MSIGLNANNDGTGSVQIGGSDAIQLSTGLNATFPRAANLPNTFGFKNRIINGGMQIAQRATSATVTAGTAVPTASTGYPAVDRFFVYSTGANVTAAQVAGSGAVKNRMQITGAASVTAVGVGQRIEQLNSYDLAGSTCTLSVDLANSVLTTVTWTANYATTADTFGTIGTPTKTQIATGTFTVTSTVTNYSVNISVPAAATTGIEILFTVGAQTSGTWTIGNVQFEKGSTATSFDVRPYGTELALCQRYYQKSYDQATAPGTNVTGTFNGLTWSNGVCDAGTSQVIPFTIVLPQSMRSTASISYWDAAGNASKFSTFTGGAFTRTDNQGGLGATYLSANSVIAGYGTPGAGNSYAFAYALSAEL